jgi:hypothetical protein
MDQKQEVIPCDDRYQSLTNDRTPSFISRDTFYDQQMVGRMVHQLASSHYD